MAQRKAWPAYVILALCGLAFVGWIVWKEIRADPVKSLTINVDAGGRVTVTARKKWSTVERTGFKRPDHEVRLFATIKDLAMEAESDGRGLPDCPVRIAAAQGTGADAVFWLMVGLMRSYLWDVTVESAGHSVSTQLPQREGCIYLYGRAERGDVKIGRLSLPETGGDVWRLVGLDFDNVFLDDYAFTKGLEDRGGKRVLVLDLEKGVLSPGTREQWQTLANSADRRTPAALVDPKEADFSGLDAVYVNWGRTSTAGDLVRAIGVLQSQSAPPKIILVEPEKP